MTSKDVNRGMAAFDDESGLNSHLAGCDNCQIVIEVLQQRDQEIFSLKRQISI
jgi:hypothetical protein